MPPHSRELSPIASLEGWPPPPLPSLAAELHCLGPTLFKGQLFQGPLRPLSHKLLDMSCKMLQENQKVVERKQHHEES